MVGVGCSIAASMASGQPAANAAPSSPVSEQPRQVKLLVLKRADAGAVAKELAEIFPPDAARIVADQRTNTLIVAAPAAMQATVLGLVEKLDLPAGHAGVATTPAASAPPAGRSVDVVPIRRGKPRLIAAAMEKLLAERPAGSDQAAIAVVRAPPMVRKVLNSLFAPLPPQNAPQREEPKPSSPPPSQSTSAANPAGGRNRLQVTILHLSPAEGAEVEQALAQAINRGPQAGTVAETARGTASHPLPLMAAKQEKPLR